MRVKKFLVVIVVYKKSLEDIVPLRYFENAKGRNFEIFIYDNSPIAQAEMINNEKYIYHHDQKNSGVSKAYNTAAHYASKNGFNWLILFDQDTEILDQNFLSDLDKYIEKYSQVNLFVPTVEYNNGKMSPKSCKFFRIRNKDFNTGINKLKNVAIINSGLTIAVDTFLKCGGYNEQTYLDLADLQFVENLEKVESHYCITSSHLFQDFSNDETSPNKLYSRFKIYCECLKGYQTTTPRYLTLLFSGFLHALALTKRTKMIKFLYYYFRNIFS